MKKAQPAITTSVRLPVYLREWLDKGAEDNRRTLNNELLFKLEKVYKEEQEAKQQAGTAPA